MKAVILAGGLGTRISEESTFRPKPMIEIGGKPILWHIMKSISFHGIDEFIICLGYKGYMIKEYFANYYLHTSDVTIDVQTNKMTLHQQHTENWKITLVDTGELTMTGGRLKRIHSLLDAEPFLFTYGDGLSNVAIDELLSFHTRHGRPATLTAVQPPGRFGSLLVEGDTVKKFQEKPVGDGGWISGGYFILDPETVSLVKNDETVWEGYPLEKLSSEGNLMAYKHHGFWQPMDTLRDKTQLEEMWSSGEAPWKSW